MKSIKRRRFVKLATGCAVGLMSMNASPIFISHQNRISELPGGAYAVMMTPYTKDLKIDYSGLKKLIKWYERAGIRGFFANCASSEMYELSPDERLNLTHFVVKNSQIPVVSTGTFSGNVDENVDFIKKIYSTGVDGVVVITSVIVEKSAGEHEFKNTLMKIVDKTGDIPLGLYECPSPYKRLVSPELLGDIADTGRFVYLKDTSCDENVVRQKIEACKNTKMGLYNAHTPDVLDTLRHDGAGTSTIASNYYPELYAYLCKYANYANKTSMVDEVNNFILKNEKVIGRKYKISSKYFMQLRGLPVQVNSRNYSGTLLPEDENKLRSLWVDLQNLAVKLDIKLA